MSQLWPPPNPATIVAARRRRRAPDIDWSALSRAAFMFVIVTVLTLAVAGGLKAVFLL